MKVEYPSDEMKKQSIQFICEQTKLKKQNAFSFLFDTYKKIGVKVIFKNAVFPYALSLVIYTLCLTLALTALGNVYKDETLFADILLLFFFASPIIMQLSELLYFVYEIPSGVLEYQNSYKYTAYQMSLLRMPLFSVATMVINCIIAIIWCGMNGISNVLAPFGLIACSVFTYSMIHVALFNRYKRIGLIIASVLWFGINGILLVLSTKVKIALFVTVPFAMHLAVAVVLMTAFAKLIKNSYLKPACLVTD